MVAVSLRQPVAHGTLLVIHLIALFRSDANSVGLDER
jgi:hypothetical protein